MEFKSTEYRFLFLSLLFSLSDLSRTVDQYVLLAHLFILTDSSYKHELHCSFCFLQLATVPFLFFY